MHEKMVNTGSPQLTLRGAEAVQGSWRSSPIDASSCQATPSSTQAEGSSVHPLRRVLAQDPDAPGALDPHMLAVKVPRSGCFCRTSSSCFSNPPITVDQMLCGPDSLHFLNDLKRLIISLKCETESSGCMKHCHLIC